MPGTKLKTFYRGVQVPATKQIKNPAKPLVRANNAITIAAGFSRVGPA
jgi:hypothetical protein